MSKWVGGKLEVGCLLTILSVGLALVAHEAVSWAGPKLRGNQVALVNQQPIDRAAFERLARQVNVTGVRDRELLLSYLIGEELLVQRALEIGLLESDHQLRNLIVRRTIDTAAQSAATATPVMVLRADVGGRPSLALATSRVEVAVARYPAAGESDLFRLVQGADEAVGEGPTFASAARDAGAALLTDVPRQALSLVALQQYVGEDVARARGRPVGVADGSGFPTYALPGGAVYLETGQTETQTDWQQIPSSDSVERSNRMASNALQRVLDEQCQVTPVWVAVDVHLTASCIPRHSQGDTSDQASMRSGQQ